MGGFAVPEHGAIHVWHLGGGGEGGAVADLEASPDEAAVLEPGVHGHGAVHAELVTEVGGVGHTSGPGERPIMCQKPSDPFSRGFSRHSS